MSICLSDCLLNIGLSFILFIYFYSYLFISLIYLFYYVLVGRGLHFNDSFMDFKISVGHKRCRGRVVKA